MRLFIGTFTIGAILLSVGMYLYSPTVTRAILNPSYTPPYWAR